MKRTDVGWIIGLACVLHAPSWFRPFMDIDEGSYAGIACRLLAGGTVYRDGVENKFPGIFYLYKAVFAAFGRYNMVAIHAAVTVAAIATALVVGAIARRYAGDRAARWAAALYVVFSAAYYPKMLAGNTEMFAVLPAAITVWCYLRARDRGWAWHLAAGAAGALTLLCKQVALATFAAVLADRALSGLALLRDPLRTLRDLALLALGFAAVLAAMALHLQHVGAWDDAVFWTWTYVLHYYMPSGTADHGFLFNVATSLVPFLVTVSPLIYLAVCGRDRAQSALYWWLAGNLAASLVGGRMYGHYFLLFVPALATLAGIGAARRFADVDAPDGTPTAVAVAAPAAGTAGFAAARDARRRERRWLIRLVAAMAIAFTAVAAMFEGATGSAFTPSPDYRDASAYVRSRTSPDDQIFVWGWFPALYQAADRCPSTRFVYTHIHSGANATGAERNHNVPEAWDMLMHDLEAAPPTYVLDTSPGDYNYAFPPERYPRLWAFLAAHYQPEVTVAGVRMFRRKEPPQP